MRFVIDTNLPRKLCSWLQTHGHEAEHVLELNLGKAGDEAIWRYAESVASAIISKDEDFADLSRRFPTGPAVVWLRTGNGTNKQLLAYLAPIWPDIEQRLSAGDRLLELR